MLSKRTNAAVFIAAMALFVGALTINSGCGKAGGALDVYSIVEAPVFSPSAGTYSSSQTVAISSQTPGATIYYTTDDSEPKETSAKYTGAISVDVTVRIRAKAYLSPKVPSSATSALYDITGTVAAPTFSPEAGTYASTQNVAISCLTSGARITYTTDGTTPTESSPLYEGAIPVAATTTIKAKAFLEDYASSAMATGVYYIGQESPPVFSPASTSEVATEKEITLTGAAGSTIYYTTDGTDPTVSSSSSPTPAQITLELDSSSPVKTQTIKAFAAQSGKAASPISSETYTLSLTAEATTRDITDNVGKYTSIALDSSGNPHISYFDEVNGAIKYVYYSGGWQAATTIATGVGAGGGYTSIAVDQTSGKVHISYYDSNVPKSLKYATYEGASWSLQTIDSGSVGAYTSIALDSSGEAHISYYDSSNKVVKHSGFDGNLWTTETISSIAVGDDIYGTSSIAVDSRDNIYVLFHNGSGNVSCRTTSPLGGNYLATLEGSGAVPGVGLVVEKSNDSAHAVYNAGELIYAYSNDLGRNWNSETANSSTGLKDFSIAWQKSSNKPHISSYDTSSGFLKYFTKSSSEWKVFAVDNSAIVGRYSSIAVYINGYFHISYYDETNGNLKYATNRP